MNKISIIIPTYRREMILVNTITQLLGVNHTAHEILVVDQSELHLDKTITNLSNLENKHAISWIKLVKPSIPNAMNVGALKATGDILLFLDDDIEVTSELVNEHSIEYLDSNVHAVAGKVVQLWQKDIKSTISSYRENQTQNPDAFQFNSSIRIPVKRFMGGNVSFRKSSFLSVGGFDNNFTKVAYRFEAEFAERFLASGYNIVFNPEASILHLKEETGGTRTFGDHRKTIRPSHSVGRYYYMLVVANQPQRWLNFITSPFKSCLTKFHLSHPWWIPVTLIAEFSGMVWAIFLSIKGQQLITHRQ